MTPITNFAMLNMLSKASKSIQREGNMAYETQIEAAIKSDTKTTPTDAQLRQFKADLLDLSTLVDSGDLSDELILQPILSQLYLLMKQAYDTSQSYRS